MKKIDEEDNHDVCCMVCHVICSCKDYSFFVCTNLVFFTDRGFNHACSYCVGPQF